MHLRIKNKSPENREVFNQQSPHLCISALTYAELDFGFEKTEHLERNLGILENFAAGTPVLVFGENAFAHYGLLRAELERSGMGVCTYDLMIAGHARIEGLVLVTNKTSEFGRVDGLLFDNWGACNARTGSDYFPQSP